jgi:hypothetical protein
MRALGSAAWEGIVMGDTVFVELSDGSVALVDPVDIARVARYDWQAPLCGERYVVGLDFSDGPCPDLIFMHRLLADAGPDDIVLHRNGDILDNRRDNLQVQRRVRAMSGSVIDPPEVKLLVMAD